MKDIINKEMKIKEVEEILKEHDIHLVNWWWIVLGMMLKECDYIKVVGYGVNAELVQVWE